MGIIKKVPIPLCGVMLGTAALGNLLQSYGEGIRSVCGVFAAVLFVLILLKVIIYPQMIAEDMKNPIMASVACTFTMGLMLLSTYVKPFVGPVAKYIWYVAIILHIVLMIYFTLKFILKLEMPKVFASYYIVYVGIAVAAVTAPAYESTGIGAIATKQTMACLANMEAPLPILKPVVLVETIIAVVLVAFVYIRFIMFLFAPAPKDNA